MLDPAPPSPSLAAQIGRAFKSRAAVVRSSPFRSRTYLPALIVLAAIPPLTALGAEALAVVGETRNRQLERALAPRLAAFRAARQASAIRLRLAPLLTRPTLSGMIDRLAAVLPPNAHLHLLALDAKGGIEARIDCSDPDALRATLHSDAVLAMLRMVGQDPADDGVRVIMRWAPS